MTFNEILNKMLASVPKEYDTSVGSFFYDLLYPVAEQIFILQNRIITLSTNTFALTAAGEYLDRKVAEQGLTRRQGVFSKGVVRITGDVGADIFQGAKVAAGNVLFAVDEYAAVPECGYIDATVTCIETGSKGNVKSGTINRFPVTLPGLTSVENMAEFTGGYDEESDADLLERYLEKVSRPNVSGNKYHYIEWAKEVIGVGDVRVIPLWNGEGTVKVVIVDADNQPADAELIQKVQAHIEERRPIGANVTVESASALEISISVKLIAEDTPDIQQKIEEAVKGYLSEDALKKSYVSFAKIGSLILSVSGVEDYTDLKVNNGTTNIPIADGAVPVLESVVFL